MLRKKLLVLLPALLMLFWCAPVNAIWRVEFHQTQGQTQAAARLKQGEFIRIRTASGKKMSGHLVSFDGSRLVLEDSRNHSLVTVDMGDIVEIKSGRGFWGALQHGVSESGRMLAKPVTDTILSYEMIEALCQLMG
jgi:small nuclear ribonucleoprotein (snRNP)-like protein